MGKNLTYLSQLDGLSFELYRDQVRSGEAREGESRVERERCMPGTECGLLMGSNEQALTAPARCGAPAAIQPSCQHPPSPPPRTCLASASTSASAPTPPPRRLRPTAYVSPCVLQVLPRVLDQITSCKDDLAQLYLMQVRGGDSVWCMVWW